jgi:hypothetical protein
MVGASTFEALSAPNATLAKGPGNKWEGRVVVNFNKEAATGVTANETVIKKMVDASILLLTGETSVGVAWKSIFPSTLTASSKIAIKINILNNGNPCPHPFSVAAICEGLQQMNFGGNKFAATNITIYDRNNSNSFDSAGYTTTRLPNIKMSKDSKGSSTDGAIDSSTNVAEKYSVTLGAADFLINVFSPRGHGSAAESFTLGFKSHYGTYDAKYHDTKTPPFLRDINCTGPVYNKTVLSVCSGIFGMNEGHGPTGGKDDYSTYSKSIDASSTNVNPTTIIMSTDPVSCEMQAIKMMRINGNKSYALNNLPKYLRASAGISGALSGTTYNIGIIDESKMDVRKIINGQSTVDVKHTNVKNQFSSPTVKAMHLIGQYSTHIEFSVPASYIKSKSTISIFSVDGRKIDSFSHPIGGVVNHCSWNERDQSNNPVQSGSYIIRVESGSLRINTQFVISR